jgi:cytochrome c oxidase subunit 1
MFGRFMGETLGKVHFWLTFIFFNAVFVPMHLVGVGGMMRRISNPTQYDFLLPLQPTNVVITVAAVCLLLGQIPFVINFFWSLFRGRVADRNPWRANTLEWSTTSPPPHGNFDASPVVYRGPYEYSRPEIQEDWLPQSQPLQTSAAGRE